MQLQWKLQLHVINIKEVLTFNHPFNVVLAEEAQSR